jgi:ankyrin repeat protein
LHPQRTQSVSVDTTRPSELAASMRAVAGGAFSPRLSRTSRATLLTWPAHLSASEVQVLRSVCSASPSAERLVATVPPARLPELAGSVCLEEVGYTDQRMHNCSCLHLACFLGLEHIVRVLLVRAGVSVRSLDAAVRRAHDPSLLLRLREEPSAALRKLLESEATNDTRPLALAGWGGDHPRILAMLFVAGASVNCRRKTGASPLYIAAARGHTLSVRLLIGLNAQYNRHLVGKIGPLGIACEYGRTRCVRSLLAAFPHTVDEVDGQGCTPLVRAVEFGEDPWEIVEALLGYGADLFTRLPGHPIVRTAGSGSCCDSVIHLACGRGSHKTLRVLLGHLSRSKTSPNDRALGGGKVGPQAATPRSSFAVNLPGSARWTPVMVAASAGYPRCVEACLDFGASPEAEDTDGFRALMLAAHFGSADCISLLIQRGACLEARQGQGATAAYIAAQQGNLDCLRVLEAHGANLNVTLNDGMSPMLAAVQRGHWHVVDWLLRNTDATFVPTHGGLGAGSCYDLVFESVVATIEDANVEMVRYLLAPPREVLPQPGLPLDPGLKHSQISASMLDMALQSGCSRVVQALFANGANPFVKSTHASSINCVYAATGGNATSMLMLLDRVRIRASRPRGLPLIAFRDGLARQDRSTLVSIEATSRALDVPVKLLDSRDATGLSPLHAASERDPDCCCLLLLSGACPASLSNTLMETPLHHAAAFSSDGTTVGLILLLGIGRSFLQTPNIAGETPLAIAQAGGYPAVERLLRRAEEELAGERSRQPREDPPTSELRRLIPRLKVSLVERKQTEMYHALRILGPASICSRLPEGEPHLSLDGAIHAIEADPDLANRIAGCISRVLGLRSAHGRQDTLSRWVLAASPPRNRPFNPNAQLAAIIARSREYFPHMLLPRWHCWRLVPCIPSSCEGLRFWLECARLRLAFRQSHGRSPVELDALVRWVPPRTK